MIKYSNINGEITIELTKHSHEVHFSVSDEGVRINPETFQDILNPNKLPSTNGTNNESGRGIGLFLCKTLIEKHNGRLWFENKLGNGTICNFSLPRKAEDKN